MNNEDELDLMLAKWRVSKLRPVKHPPCKRKSKSGHKYCRQQRAMRSMSMMDMGQERFHRMPVNDSRTKELLAGYYRRKANKQ